MKKTICSILLAIIFMNAVFAQKKTDDSFLSDFVSRNWTTADGLPANSVTQLIQDSVGYIYFGTYDGLVRFDGVEFTTITRNTDPKYAFISARSLFLDSADNIWIGSNDEGVVKICKDGTTESYSMEEGLPNNSIRSICEDKNGNIWIGTAAGLAYIADGKIVIPGGLESFSEKHSLGKQLYCDTAGRIWILTGKENKAFIYTNRKFERYTGITKKENPAVTCITQDNTGAFWFGVAPHYAVKTEGNREEIFDIGNGDVRGTSIEKIYQDRNSNIWCALDTGIAVIHNGKISYINKTSGLSDNRVSDIMEDKEGNLWLATVNAGIEKLSLSKFKTVAVEGGVNAICYDKTRESTWIGGNNGLFCYKNDEFVENEITEFCKSVRIRHVEATEDGELLISTYEKLGQVIVSEDGKIRSITKDDGLSGNKTRAAIKSHDGLYYIGTTNGLNIIEPDGKIVKVTTKNGIQNDYIMCVFESSDNKIWCGTDGGGIFTIERTTEEKKSGDKNPDGYKISNKITTKDGLSGNIIFKISEMDKNIWVCTGAGMSRIKNGKIFNFNTSNGLETTEVMQIISDYTGTAWLTSNRGIFSTKLEDLDECADGKLKRISTRYFGKSDGFISAGVTSTSLSAKDSIGRIYFTLIDGFAIYDPVKITANQFAPVIQIQEITIDNEKKPWDGKPIKLGPGVKRFAVKFTGISFVTSEQTQFATELEGFDKEYTPWTHERRANYTNLKPGKYKFSVIAKSGNDIMSQPVEFTIEKQSYLWEMPAFWITATLITLITATLCVFMRIKALEKQKIILKEEVDRQTDEILRILMNMLPKETAEELSANPTKAIAESHQNVTVLFTDIVGYTKTSAELSAETIGTAISALYAKFEQRAKREQIERIKAIGDTYMAACGLNREKDAAERMIRHARGLLHDLNEFNSSSEIKISIRIGLNTGSLIAGVIGKSNYIYDVWGDTVNTANIMKSTGVPMKIHVSESTFAATKNIFEFEGPIEVETGERGKTKTYYIE